MFLSNAPAAAVALSSMQTDQTLDKGRSSDVWVMSERVEELLGDRFGEGWGQTMPFSFPEASKCDRHGAFMRKHSIDRPE